MNPFENERKEIDEYSQDELERVYGAQPEYDEEDWYNAFDEEQVSVEDPDDPELLDAPEDLDPPEDFDGYWADLDEPQVDEIEEISVDAPTPDDFEDEDTEWPEWKEEEEEVVEESAPLTEDVLTEGPFKAIAAKIFDGKLKQLFKKYQVVLGNNTPMEFNTFADADRSAKTERVRAATSSDATNKKAEALVYGVLADKFASNSNIQSFLGAKDGNKVLLVKRSGDDGETGVDYSKQVLEKLKKWQEAEKAAKKGTQVVDEAITKVADALKKLPETIPMDAREQDKLKPQIKEVKAAFDALTDDQKNQIEPALKTRLTNAIKLLDSAEETPPTEETETTETTTSTTETGTDTGAAASRGNAGLDAANRTRKAYRALNSLGITDREQQKKIIQALQAALGGNK